MEDVSMTGRIGKPGLQLSGPDTAVTPRAYTPR